MKKEITYADSGVNIELGDDVSKVLYNAAKQTWKNREGKLGELVVPFDDFSGVRAIDVSRLPKGTLMNMGFDGVGTKMELAERIGDHRTIAYDLFAMVCDDAVVRGAEPVLIGSILDVNSLGKDGENYLNQINQLAEGYINAAKEANVVVVNGEVAEIGSRVGGYGPFNYNWGAAITWFANENKMLTGYKIKPGDSLVTFKEEGYRSNGLSLVRLIMESVIGKDWHKNEDFVRQILKPSKIYARAVVDMIGGALLDKPKAEIHGVAHITGGGIPGKLGRMLKPSGFGAYLDSLYEPCDMMNYCQKMGNVSDEKSFTTWNKGNGMIIATPEPNKVIAIAEKYGIESKIGGEVTKKPGIVIEYNKRMGPKIITRKKLKF